MPVKGIQINHIMGCFCNSGTLAWDLCKPNSSTSWIDKFFYNAYKGFGLFKLADRGLINLPLDGDVSVITSLLGFDRGAAANVQSFGLKAVAVVLMRLYHLRSPEWTTLVIFFMGFFKVSKKINVSITCPECSQAFSVELYRSIWVEDNKNLDLIKNDKINVMTCPRCHFHQRVEFPFLCTNVKRGFALWYEPYPDPQIDKDIADYKKMMGQNSFYARAPRIPVWSDFKKKLIEMESSSPISAKPISISPDMQKKIAGFVEYLEERKRLQELFDGPLKTKGLFPNVEQTPDFPFSNYKTTVSAIQSGKAHLSFGLPNHVAFNAIANRREKIQHLVGMLSYWLAGPIVLIAGAVMSENYWLFLWGLLLFPLAFFGTHPHYKKSPKFLIFLTIGFFVGLIDGHIPTICVSIFLFLVIAGYSFNRHLYNRVLIERSLEIESALMFLLGCNYLQLCDKNWSLLWTPAWLKDKEKIQKNGAVESTI